MSTTLSRAVVLVALLAATPLLAREAVAQRDGGRVHAAAFVTGAVQVFSIRADTAAIRPARDVQRLAIAGIGSLEVQCGPGAATHMVQREARLVRVTIDFVAN
jgi:hypothetical protein